ncbi:hypothetical protein BpHYR1_016040 [Brachionus plicatilis]|uniref:Uncharacterized protein n=1 Tax=Brachionus plicatilis TaxID=10195 RepID=A0A3M7R4T5_BRAPC|nr:hypothetical protein BpHYR1_016040 [Brachionus plicatilis]
MFVSLSEIIYYLIFNNSQLTNCFMEQFKKTILSLKIVLQNVSAYINFVPPKCFADINNCFGVQIKQLLVET